MSAENSTKSTKLCPTCGTRVKEDADSCLVCGSSLSSQDTSKKKTDQGVRGSRMPAITLGLPAALGLLALFLVIGALMVFFGLQRTGRVTEPTVTPTVTLTVTPTMTPTPATPTVTPTLRPSPTPFTYIIQPGDTCGGIAFAFDISVQSIVRTNNLPAACDTLFEGQSLFIPYPTPTATSFPTATLSGLEATIAACDRVDYKVQENDTLSSISTNYNVPMEAIKEFNGMVNNTVFVGMPIIIPLCERAATPGPTPTPTAPPPYPAPNLLLPPDGTHFTLDDDIVTLQWSAVGTIHENERYEITVEDVTEGQNRQLVAYVEDTKFIVPTSFRASDNAPHVYRWWVMPVRQINNDEEGNPVWATAGVSSLKRVFTWIGVAAVTPTP